MGHLRVVVVFTFLLGLVSGRGDECDVYVANAGAGNCIFVLFSAKNDRRGLWVDCGFGCRGAVPAGFPVTSSEDWNQVVGDFFLGKESPWQGAKVKDKTMLWITHLHGDHLNRILQINRDDYREGNKKEGGVEVGFAVVGVGGGEKDLPKDIEEAREQAQKAEKQAAQKEGKKGPNLLDEILNWPIGDNIQKVRVWGEGSEASAKCGDISKVVGNFWGDFPRENIKMEPLIPTGGYAQGQKNLKANDTSLVLALTYYGVKILFPGDAPGEMHDYLGEVDREFVKDVDILIAPHHGSENDHNSLWYSSNRRFCTIISGDPSYKAWGIPGLANYGVRSHSTRLKEPRAIYYSNAQRNEVLKSEIEFPVFCTWVGVENKDGKAVDAPKFVGYHIKINSNGNREDAGKIKVFEILYNDKAKENETKYPEKEICIERLSKRLELSGTSVLFEVPNPQAKRKWLSICPGDTYHVLAGIASFLLGGFCGAVLWAASH